jgi:hypothetical protein
MSRKRFIIYDQLPFTVEADKDLTETERRQLLKALRGLGEALCGHAQKQWLPANLKDKVKFRIDN